MFIEIDKGLRVSENDSIVKRPIKKYNFVPTESFIAQKATTSLDITELNDEIAEGVIFANEDFCIYKVPLKQIQVLAPPKHTRAPKIITREGKEYEWKNVNNKDAFTIWIPEMYMFYKYGYGWNIIYREPPVQSNLFYGNSIQNLCNKSKFVDKLHKEGYVAREICTGRSLEYIGKKLNTLDGNKSILENIQKAVNIILSGSPNSDLGVVSQYAIFYNQLLNLSDNSATDRNYLILAFFNKMSKLHSKMNIDEARQWYTRMRTTEYTKNDYEIDCKQFGVDPNLKDPFN